MNKIEIEQKTNFYQTIRCAKCGNTGQHFIQTGWPQFTCTKCFESAKAEQPPAGEKEHPQLKTYTFFEDAGKFVRFEEHKKVVDAQKQEIESLKTELREISRQFCELYDQTCDTTPPEIYASILGLHERLDIALQEKP